MALMLLRMHVIALILSVKHSMCPPKHVCVHVLDSDGLQTMVILHVSSEIERIGMQREPSHTS